MMRQADAKNDDDRTSPLGLQFRSERHSTGRESSKGSTRAEVKSRRRIAATAKVSSIDGWSAWSATAQTKRYSLVRIIARWANATEVRSVIHQFDE
jgi:hypothetical protein